MRSSLAGAVALLLALPTALHAERYRVDLIVFADKTGAGDEAPLAVQAPLERALELHDSAGLAKAGIELLPDTSFGLTEAWSRLRNSRDHQPLLRLAWVQKDPPAERGVALRLRHGVPYSELTAQGSSTVYPVDGTVALRAGRFLHLDADFVHTQADRAGELSSYRLRERRRLRRDELHHLDGPKLGVLVRVQRADPKPDNRSPATGKTQPAPAPAPKPR